MKTSLKVFFSALVALPLLAPTFVWASDDYREAKNQARDNQEKARAQARAAQDEANRQAKALQCLAYVQEDVLNCEAKFYCDEDPTMCEGMFEDCLWAAALMHDHCLKLDDVNDMPDYNLWDHCDINNILGMNKCEQKFDKDNPAFFKCKLGVSYSLATCYNANYPWLNCKVDEIVGMNLCEKKFDKDTLELANCKLGVNLDVVACEAANF